MTDTDIPRDGTPVEVQAGPVRPSQLYLSSAKLGAVCEAHDGTDPTADGLPVRPVAELAPRAPADGPPLPTDGLVLMDGHTRAFCARLAGRETLTVRYDTDDLPLPIYARCVGWCVEDGVKTVDDLFGRVLDHETFETAWIERCHNAPEYPD